MTSNVGARQGGSLGFGDEPNVDYVSEVKRAFKPEFVNRLDNVVAFRPLDAKAVHEITAKELGDLRKREGIDRFGRRLSWTSQLVDFLASQGVEAGLGARPLQRAIETHVVAPLSTWLVQNPDADFDRLLLGWNESRGELEITIGAAEN